MAGARPWSSRSTGPCRGVTAIGACPNQHDLVIPHVEARWQTVGQARWALAGHVEDAVAVVALEVVVMWQTCEFVPAWLARQVHWTDQAAFGEPLERAIDRREINRRRIGLGGVENLRRTQRPLEVTHSISVTLRTWGEVCKAASVQRGKPKRPPRSSG